MKAIVTGMNGTVAPVLAEGLKARGVDVVAWDRGRIPVDDLEAIGRFIEDQEPDMMFHLAMGSPDWAATMARIAAERWVPFLFTSTVMVFSSKQNGPFSPETRPEPEDDYGLYKLDCERRISEVNPAAIIARLGWQMGHNFEGNQMLAHLQRQFVETGRVEASTAWYPGCSFLEDSAAALIELVEQGRNGVFHIGGNPGFNFYEVVSAVSADYSLDWKIVATAEHVQNNRLVDDRLKVGPISDRLSSLSS